MLYKYFTICLFDDHGVDNIKAVTMAQWKTNPRVLVIHGAGGCESEDSYITIVAVPNLGCLDCKKLRDEFCTDAVDGEYDNTYVSTCFDCFLNCNDNCIHFQLIEVVIYVLNVISQFTLNIAVLILILCSIRA